jgi:hypothetical protein
MTRPLKAIWTTETAEEYLEAHHSDEECPFDLAAAFSFLVDREQSVYVVLKRSPRGDHAPQ